MRILYINKIHTNAGWGSENFLNAALQEQGVETICVDYEQNKFKLAQTLLNLQQDFDAVLLHRGRGYLLPASLLRAINRPRFFLFTELIERNWLQHYLLRNNLFNHVFLRSPNNIRHVTQKGWLQPNQVTLMLSAIRPEFHRPLPDIAKNIDLLFIGSITPRRQEILADLQKEFNITIQQAFGEEMVQLINRAKILLNIHAEEPLDTEIRVYEVLACKGFLLTEKLSEESPFQNGQHLVESTTLNELKQNIRTYLEHPERRQPIAEAGYQYVIQHHTFTAQAKQVIATIEPHLSALPHTQGPFDQAQLRKIRMEEQAKNFMQPLTNATFRVLGMAKRTLHKTLRRGA